MANKSRVHAAKHPQQKSEPPQPGIDLSLLQMPMALSLTGALQVARCLSSGTAEMRELLTEECDIIFECRVCRNLFRNLPNFIAHKRHYCKECYSDSRLRFVETKPEHETLLIQPQPPKEPAAKTVKVKDVETSSKETLENTTAKPIESHSLEKKNTHASKTQEVKEKTKDVTPNGSSEGKYTNIIETEGKSEAFKLYTQVAEKAEQREDLRKRSLVELEDVKGNKNAKKQKVILEAEEDDIKTVSKKHHRGPSHADLAIITESFDRVSNSGDLSSVDGDGEGPRRISLRNRGGSGEVCTPIAERLKKRDDCDVKTQTCLKCKAKYSSLKTLHFHMMSLHAERRTIYPCVYAKCKATFTRISTASRHLQRAHDCTKKQIEKMRDNLKKFAYTCPVDEIAEDEDPHHPAPPDPSLLRSNRRKQAEAHKEKVEKVKKEASDTINHVTKRLSDKLKKQKDTMIDFGSGFSLYKCLNCSKAFAKKDSLNRHQAFCFGIGGSLGADDDKASVSSSRSARARGLQTKKEEKQLVNELNRSDKGTTKSPGKETLKQAITKEQITKKKTSPQKGDVAEVERKRGDVSPQIILERLSPKQVSAAEISSPKKEVLGVVKRELVEQFKDGSTDPKLKEPDTDQSESEPLSESMNESFDSDGSKTDTHISRWSTELDDKELEKVRNLIDEDNLQCLKCNRKYGSISNLHRHALRHLGWKRFRCTLCDFTAYNRSECKTHLSRVHMEKSCSNPSKFILDLEPDKMKLGVSARSRVESKRPSSLRILERMQQARKEQQSADRKTGSPSKSGIDQNRKIPVGGELTRSQSGPGFNISTRKSPRDYDMRPYKHIENTAVLFTRSGHYPKPILQKTSEEDSEMDSETDNVDVNNVQDQIKIEAPDSNGELSDTDGGEDMGTQTNELPVGEETGSSISDTHSDIQGHHIADDDSETAPLVQDQQADPETEGLEETDLNEGSDLIVEGDVGEESQVIEEEVIQESEVIEEEVTEESQVIEEAAMEESQVIEEEVTEESQVIEEAVMEESQVIEEEVTEESQVIEDMETTEVIYLVMDPEADVNPATTLGLSTTETTVMQTVAMDTSGQLAIDSGDQQIYILDDGLGNFTASSSDVGLAEEVVVEGEVGQEAEVTVGEELAVVDTPDDTAIAGTECSNMEVTEPHVEEVAITPEQEGEVTVGEELAIVDTPDDTAIVGAECSNPEVTEPAAEEVAITSEQEADSNSDTGNIPSPINDQPDCGVVNEADTDINSNLETLSNVENADHALSAASPDPCSDLGSESALEPTEDPGCSSVKSADTPEVSEDESVAAPLTRACVDAV